MKEKKPKNAAQRQKKSVVEGKTLTYAMSKALKDARIAAGLTQAEAAKAIGFSDTSLGEYERCEAYTVTTMFLKKAAELYKVPYDYLLAPPIGKRKRGIGINLCELRVERHLSLADVAAGTDISRRELRNIETEISGPTMGQIKTLSRFYGVDAEKILEESA